MIIEKHCCNFYSCEVAPFLKSKYKSLRDTVKERRLGAETLRCLVLKTRQPHFLSHSLASYIAFYLSRLLD